MTNCAEDSALERISSEHDELTDWAKHDHLRRSIDRVLVRVFRELSKQQKLNGGENWEFNSAMESMLREDIEALAARAEGH